MKAKDVIAKLIAQPRGWVPFGHAMSQLDKAFVLPSELGQMVLFGLIASGEVRASRDGKTPIDLDECTISELSGQADFVDANGLDAWLRQHSKSNPSLKGRQEVVAELLHEFGTPPGDLPWKEFENKIRDRWGSNFSHKTIQRDIKEILER